MDENKPNEEQNKDNDLLYKMCEEACKIFFDTKRLKDLYDLYENNLEVKPIEVQYDDEKGGQSYDITGLDALQVIAVMTAIVNDPDKCTTGKIFYFFIKRKKDEEDSVDDSVDDSVYKIFKLRRNITDNQPGNGMVSVLFWCSEVKEYVEKQWKSHATINKALAQTSPKAFANVIQKLFKDNSEIGLQEDNIAEEYFLLLFEIARRLSNKTNKTEEGMALDNLPIGSAIARKIKTLAAKSGKTGLEAELKSLSGCFTCRRSNSRKTRIKLVIQSDADESPTTPRSCEEELACLKEMFCGLSTVDLTMGRLSLEDTDASATQLQSPTQPPVIPQWLITRLQDYEPPMRPYNVAGDGNCFFSAVAHQYYGDENRHRDIRIAGVEYIRDNSNNFEGFSEESSLQQYIDKMSKDFTWCDEPIMRAVVEAFNLKIHIIRPNDPENVLEPQENPREAPRRLVVGYINNETHYVSVEPLEKP